MSGFHKSLWHFELGRLVFAAEKWVGLYGLPHSKGFSIRVYWR